VKGLAGVLFALLLSTLVRAAQFPVEQIPQSSVFRSGASLVALNVSVVGPDKHFVTGLDASDFVVFEDGVRQEVRFFESSAVPVDLIILLDTSSSMRHRMEMVHEAALGFINTLRQGDRAAVVAFNDGVRVIQPLTSDRAVLEAAIRSTTANGGTALNNALYVALKQFGRGARDTGDIRRQALAVLSDGNDTASLVSFDDVMELAQKSGVCVYPIALTSEAEKTAESAPHFQSQSQYAMRQLAQQTGAQAFFPATVRELSRIYSSIAEEISHQYSIAYSPTNPRFDGSFRRIVVQVTSRPDAKPRARTGYLAVADSAAPGMVH
jgi:Ca-activated chloride channel family protein